MTFLGHQRKQPIWPAAHRPAPAVAPVPSQLPPAAVLSADGVLRMRLRGHPIGAIARKFDLSTGEVLVILARKGRPEPEHIAGLYR